MSKEVNLSTLFPLFDIFKDIQDEQLCSLKKEMQEKLQPFQMLHTEFKLRPQRIPMSSDLTLDGYILTIQNPKVESDSSSEKSQSSSDQPFDHFEVQVDKDGDVVLFQSVHEVDLKEIAKECILQPGDTFFQFMNNKVCYQGTPIKIRCLKRSTIEEGIVSSHHPFALCDTDENIRYGFDASNLLLTPEFDLGPTKIAMIVNKYAWGMNVGAAYFDTENHTLYTWLCENFDHPAGYAIRRNPENKSDYQIYLDCDNQIKKTIYRHPSKPLLDCLETFYRSEQWTSLHIQSGFRCLKKQFHQLSR